MTSRGENASVKLIALLVFAVAVVALPRGWVGAHVAAAAIPLTALVIARVPLRTVLRRLVIGVPFLGFALLMPFIATGPRTTVAGVELAVEGLWGAWGLLAKATICILAATYVSTTTSPRRIVLALEALRLPRELTQIMAFMLRYLELILAESRRMSIARTARGFQPRDPRSWPALAASVGSLFVRAHGRGERIHLAQLSRGRR